MPSVSVITPSLNQGAYIRRTIGSVLSQCIPELDYVVVDGGSTDETLEILKQFEAKLSWISEADKGQADAVNKGIIATNGEIIGWLNSDDIYYPGALRLVVSLFETHSNIDVIYGDGNHIATDDRIIEPYPTQPWNAERLKSTCYLCQPAVFFRRRVIDRFGLLDHRLRYCLDYEFWLRLSEGGATFLYVPEILAGSRLYPSTKTLAFRVKTVQETNHMLLRRLGYVPDEWLLSYARIFLNRKGIRRLNGGRLDSPITVPTAKGASAKPFGTMAAAPLLAMTAVFVTLSASLRWNRCIRRSMIRTLSKWIRSHANVLSGRLF